MTEEERCNVLQNGSTSLLLLQTEVPRLFEDGTLRGRVLSEVKKQGETLSGQNGQQNMKHTIVAQDGMLKDTVVECTYFK